MYCVIQRGIRLFLRVYHRVEIEGLEHVPTRGPFLVVGNHISVLDPFYIAAVLPGQVSFMAKEESFSHPVSRWFLERVGAFPVNREGVDTRSLRTALALLKYGKSVGLFPEGGRRESDPLTELKEGAAWLAIRSDVPILPVVIEGTDEALAQGNRWLRPAKVRIRFGGLLSGSIPGNPKEKQAELTSQMMTSFQSLGSRRSRGFPR